MSEQVGRRAFFAESVKGLLGGLAGFALGAGQVKELHAKELHLTGNVLDGVTLRGSMVHVHTWPDQHVSISNIVAYDEHETGGPILRVTNDGQMSE